MASSFLRVAEIARLAWANQLVSIATTHRQTPQSMFDEGQRVLVNAY